MRKQNLSANVHIDKGEIEKKKQIREISIVDQLNNELNMHGEYFISSIIHYRYQFTWCASNNFVAIINHFDWRN